MYMAMLSVENMIDGNHEIWNVNVEAEYDEEKAAAPPHSNQ